MPFDRFQLLLRHLRIFPHNTNNNLPSPYDRIEQWSQHIQQISTAFIELGTCLSVDECMIRFTGRSSATTVVKNKPTPHGFKVWVVAQGGLFLRWIWHKPGSSFGPIGLPIQRKRKRGADEEPRLSLTQRVVVYLVSLLPCAIYHVFFDNLFSSPALFRILRKEGWGATGTARSNCGFYRPFVQMKAADKAGGSQLGYNEVRTAATPDNLVNQIIWKDHVLVMFLSTVHTGADFELRQRKRPTARTAQSQPIRTFFGNEEVKVFPIPSIAAAYNDEMGGVDRGDQRRAGKGYDHHVCRGGWQALAWTFLFDTVLVNSFILQAQGQPNWKPFRSQVDWRQCLFDAIINTYGSTGSSRKIFRAGDTITPKIQHIRVRRKNPSTCLACHKASQNHLIIRWVRRLWISSRHRERPQLDDSFIMDNTHGYNDILR
ncbi:hypothetical protein HZ326_30283 [Fusarium oxysporum f. sp. albedinis]|nr:hypothetical protein HZ326_30283 [Fusarium oxysporum f. sp. albedinis]